MRAWTLTAKRITLLMGVAIGLVFAPTMAGCAAVVGDESSTPTIGKVTPSASAPSESTPSQPVPSQTEPSLPSTVGTPQPSTGAVDALAQLAAIPVKGRAPMTGYSSVEAFWGMWGNQPDGCDSRNFVLARDMTGLTMKSGSKCLVQTGTLADPYTGTTISFVRGSGANRDGGVQIDHVVARGNAWATGAFAWTPDQRAAFANDPLDLLAVDATANQKKGDGDAATWLPSNKAFRCQYVTIQVEVKAKYNLWMTQAEHDAIAKILEGC